MASSKNIPDIQPGETPWCFPEGAKVYILDIETDGLLDELTRLHSLVVRDYHSGDLVCSLGSVSELSGEQPFIVQDVLDQADILVAHNGYLFDYPALQKLGLWSPQKPQILLDTLPICRLIYSYLDDIDASLMKTGRLPGNLFGSHSLKAWGIRLGEHKGDYESDCKAAGIENPWAQWSPEMQSYCEQDTLVTLKLLQRLLSKTYSQRAVDLELRVAQHCAKMHFNGFPFDVKKAQDLYSELSGIAHDAQRRAKEAFGSWWEGDHPHYPKRGRKVFIASDNGFNLVNRGTKARPSIIRGYYQGFDPESPFTPIRRIEFNPSSRDHIGERLIALRGWSPGDFTETGKPKLDETTLKGLPWPEAKELARLFIIEKRLGQLGNGKNAWLKLVSPYGRIHGSINPNGAVTGRATHSRPNIAQVPSVEIRETKLEDGSVSKEVLWGETGEWGADCRALFTAPEGRTLIGADLSKLELLCLAHFLGKWDDGAYAEIVLSGDPHVFMQNAAGVDTRYKGKTLNYALVYGGGDLKLGHTADPMLSPGEKIARGRMIRRKIMRNFTGYQNLVAGTRKAHEERGFLFGLDGRKVRIRAAHSAVNTLLQSAGTLIAKQWIIELVAAMENAGADFQLHAWIHDEIQFSVPPDQVEGAKTLAVSAAARAGEFFNLRVPILAEAKSGANWQETH